VAIIFVAVIAVAVIVYPVAVIVMFCGRNFKARQTALGHSPLDQSFDLEGHDLVRVIAVAVIFIVMVCGRH